MTTTLRIMRVGNHDLPLPRYQSKGASGIDFAVPETITVPALSIYAVNTGYAVALPYGHEGQIRIRSSVARQGLMIPNSPGTIDQDYRGEIVILLRNQTLHPIKIERGHRVAQLVVAPVTRVAIEEVNDLDPTVRGEGAFGSTGV